MNKPAIRVVKDRMVKISNVHGKYYVPVIGNRWLLRSFTNKTEAKDYRARVRRRCERRRSNG